MYNIQLYNVHTLVTIESLTSGVDTDNYIALLHITIAKTLFSDFAFGRCVSKDDDSNDDFYRFSDFSAEEEDFLENEMARLYDEGFVWTDDYTQCVLQTALAAIRDQ